MILDFNAKKAANSCKLEDVLTLDEWKLDCSVNEFVALFPICNHTDSVNSNNIGYTQGYMNYKIPFEAELYTNNYEEIAIGLIMPEQEELEVEREIKPNFSSDGKVVGVVSEVESWDNSVLKIGMVDSGRCEDLDIIANYVEFLEQMGIIEFTSNVRNGSIFRLTDIAGNELVQVLVTLKQGDEVFATTPLHFRSFL